MRSLFIASIIFFSCILKSSSQSHPFLIVKETDYPLLRNKSSKDPWKKIITNANEIFKRDYDPNLPDLEDRAHLMRDIISAGTLLWIVDPQNKDTYKTKVVSIIKQFGDLQSNSTLYWEWSHNVPFASTAFNVMLSLDILYDEISDNDRKSVEDNLLKFLKKQNSQAWLESYYAAWGTWYLYKGDRTNIDKYKKLYREELEGHITEDGVYNGGTGYSLSRLIKDSREHKYMFMDVLQFNKEDDFYNDPLFQKLHVWLFAHNLNTYGVLYPFGDAKMGTSAKENLEESPGALRASKFSELAGRYAQFYMDGDIPIPGRLLNYIAVVPDIKPLRPNLSTIYKDGGAWLISNTSNQENVTGILWNTKSSEEHAHKETNAIHLAAYGEDLVVNSGYNNWGNGVFSFSWDYIHNQAKSCNTVLINNQDHSKKHGAGISTGFIIDSVMGISQGESGPAISNGKHSRTLHMLYPESDAAGYWVVLDKVIPNNKSDDAQIIFHPRSTSIKTIENNKHYQWAINRWTQNGVSLDIFLASPPSSVSIIDGAQADKSNSVKTKSIKSSYVTNADGEIRAMTLFTASDQNHPTLTINAISTSDYKGFKIPFSNKNNDAAILSNKSAEVEFESYKFSGEYFFRRVKADTIQFLVAHKTTKILFDNSRKGITSEGDAFSIYLNGISGLLSTENETTLKFNYPAIKEIQVGGKALAIAEKGKDFIKVVFPKGEIEFIIVAESEVITNLSNDTNHGVEYTFEDGVLNSSTATPLNYHIYTCEGKTIEKGYSKSIQIDFRPLTKGIYLLKVGSQNIKLLHQ